LTGEVHRSDRSAPWAASGAFEAEDTYRDRKSCIEAKQGAVVGYPSDGATTRFLKVPFGGVYPSIM
jgi:hypothetical protein